MHASPLSNLQVHGVGDQCLKHIVKRAHYIKTTCVTLSQYWKEAHWAHKTIFKTSFSLRIIYHELIIALINRI